MKPGNKTETIRFRCDSGTRDRASALAEKNQWSLSILLRTAVREFLQRQEESAANGENNGACARAAEPETEMVGR